MHPFFIVSLVVLTAWPFSQKNRPPKHLMIEVAYFKCDKCNTLAGGIWGKGTKWFHGHGQKDCIHDWKKISRDEFKALAVKMYACDWKKEIPFWHHEEDTAEHLKNAQGVWSQIDAAQGHEVKLTIENIDYRWETTGRTDRGRLRIEPPFARGTKKTLSARSHDSATRTVGFFELKGDRLVLWLKDAQSANTFQEEPDATYSTFEFVRKPN